MAWQLRQPIEGDRLITVADVDNNVSNCYVDESGYIANSIAFELDGVEYLVLAASSFSFGFFVFNLPSNLILKGNSTIRVFSKCDSNTTTLTTIKPVNFKVTNSPITTCNPNVTLKASYEDFIRLFFGEVEGTVFNLKLNNQNFDFANFSYQPGTGGTISSVSGDYSVGVTTESSSLYSNNTFSVPSILKITPLSTQNYFTVRLGYIEVIYNSGDLLYNNYLTGQTEIIVATGVGTSDNIEIESNSSSYVVKVNGVNKVSILKDLSFAVSGGTVSPTSGNIDTNVVWILPTSAGTYNVVVTLGTNLQFTNTVKIHSCAAAVNDAYTGVYGEVYSGNLLTNDTKCIGENTYAELNVAPAQGSVVINSDGTFSYTPLPTFTGTATFSYRLRCGDTLQSSEQVSIGSVSINYSDPCFGVNADWEDTGDFRCTNCVDEKKQTDTNKDCTNNPDRWIQNPNGTQCNRTAVYTAIDEYQCISCVEKRVEKDTNTCSPTFNQTRLVNYPSGNTCNTESVWIDTGETRCQGGLHQKRQTNQNDCGVGEERWLNTGLGLCKCLITLKVSNLCDENVVITGVVVKRRDIVESNRIESFGNGVISFYADNGVFSYDIYVTQNNGIVNRIKYNNYNCNPS